MKKIVISAILLAFTFQVNAEWKHEITEDKMGRGSDEIASVESINTLSLLPPYEGQQKAALALRKMRKGDNQIVIAIKSGQLICETGGCSILLRADEGESFSVKVSHPKDGSSNMLIGNLDTASLRKIKNAKKVFAEITIYQNGDHVVEFDTVDNPFVGRKVYLMDELKEAIASGSDIKKQKNGEFNIGESSFSICRKALLTKSDADGIVVTSKNTKSELVVDNYSETGMTRSSCSKGGKGILMSFYEYQ
ncbi:hypothetical protein ACTWOG_005310 [Serratia marcescens]